MATDPLSGNPQLPTDQRFQLLADHAPVMIWVCDTNNKGTWFNKPWLDFVGRPLEEELGEGWAANVHPEDLNRCIDTCGGAFARREPFRMEFRMRRHDGAWRWVLDHGIPVYDGDGRFTGYVGSCIDITERMEVEQALREGEERFRGIVNQSSVGIAQTDPQGRFVLVNQRFCEMVGYSADELYRMRMLDITHPEEGGRNWQLFEQLLRHGTPFRIEKRYLRKDGSIVWVENNVYGVSGPQGVKYVVAVVIDVTEQRRAHEQREQILASERAARTDAERASRMKDEFLATLSHELRTPLNAILGWAQLLRTGHASDQDLAQGLEAIERNSRAQAQLIEDLLDMSRIISGKLRLDPQRVDLLPIVNAAVETVRPAADARQITIERALGPQTGPVWGDPARLQQIVWNLLSNAIKFTPPGGRVDVRLSQRHAQVHVVVADTGQGIRPEFLPHVFDRFRQADASTTRRHGGLGLGLAIVKHLAELQGGTVHADSSGENRGAAFTVTFPVMSIIESRQAARFATGGAVAGAARAASQPNSFTREAPSLRGLSVLVVDDDPDAREVVKRVLEECDASVVTAASAREARRSLEDRPPDVIISDISMPEEDGYSLIRSIRSRGASKGGRIPAAALTAFARAEDRTRAMLAGYQAHVSKPVEPAELVAVVATLAGRTGTASPLTLSP